MERKRPLQKKYEYLTDNELEQIEKIATEIRKSHHSRESMVSIVTSFGEFHKGNLFGATYDHISSYIGFLKDGVANNRFKEQYCACIFLELRVFFAAAVNHGLMGQNPFGSLENPFRFQSKLDVSNLPTLSEVDYLLTQCNSHPTLKLFVLFAFRMGLTVSEMVNLRKKDFIFNAEDGKTYLKCWRFIDGIKAEAFLRVPNDLLPYINEIAAESSIDFPYLFRNNQGKPFAVRTIQFLLLQLQEGQDRTITFSSLRSLCIYLMLVKKVPTDQICMYANMRDEYFSRYDSIPANLIVDAIDYVNIKVL